MSSNSFHDSLLDIPTMTSQRIVGKSCAQNDGEGLGERNKSKGGSILSLESRNYKPADNDTITTTSSTSSKRAWPDTRSPLPPTGIEAGRRMRSRRGDNISYSAGREENPRRKRRRTLRSVPKPDGASVASRSIALRLKDLYMNRLLPVERKWGLQSFCLPTGGEIDCAEFDARPMVMILGQYSTGKTTLIRHLIGGNFPGMHIGPEPTTDRFMVLLHGENDDEGNNSGKDMSDDDSDRSISGSSSENLGFQLNGRVDCATNGKILKGNTLTVLPDLPFSSLSTFGAAFLNHFEGSITSAPLLKHVTLVDTPGILSGEKQRLTRTYDFAKVTEWFADRSDLVLLLFDAHKLDISDEFQDVVDHICKNNEDKIRCVLNKADGVTKEQLVRVYGSLMWSMGKMFSTPEVVRMYTGSFWDEPLCQDDFKDMFESDEGMLIKELVTLPKSSAERKLNQMVKRIRIVKVHICILGHLRQKMPKIFGRKGVQEKLIANLDHVFNDVMAEHKLSDGDMPNVAEFAECLRNAGDFSDFPSLDRKTLSHLDELLKHEIPKLTEAVGVLTETKSSSEIIDGKAKRQLLCRVAKKIRGVRMVADTAEAKGQDNASIKCKGGSVTSIFLFSLEMSLGIICTIILVRWIF